MIVYTKFDHVSIENSFLVSIFTDFAYFECFKFNIAARLRFIQNSDRIVVDLCKAGIGEKALVDLHILKPVYMHIFTFYHSELSY